MCIWIECHNLSHIMKTISFGSAKNIGKKEKYYLKKYKYYKKFPNFHMIQCNQNYYLTVNRCELTNYAQTLYQIC